MTAHNTPHTPSAAPTPSAGDTASAGDIARAGHIAPAGHSGPATHAAPRGHRPPVAVITGASRGLGAVLATALAERGWWLVVDARTPDELTATAADLARRTRVTALPGDIVDDVHRDDLTAAATDLGGARLLVHNASILGGSPLPRLAEITPAALLATFEVNVLAPLALTRLLIPQLRERDASGLTGAVLGITSDAAVEAYPGWGAYGAAKAALDHAAAVLGAEEPDLPVWTVDPGDLRTRLHQEAFPGEDISDRPPPGSAVPGLLWVIRHRPPSGRYRVTDLPDDSAVPLDPATHPAAEDAAATGSGDGTDRKDGTR